MPIELDERGFIIWADAIQTPSLGLDSDQLPECIAEVKRRDLKGVFGTVPYFREPDLHFLNQLPSLTDAAFWDITLSDISGLYGLSHLTYLRISGKRPWSLSACKAFGYSSGSTARETLALIALEILKSYICGAIEHPTKMHSN